MKVVTFTVELEKEIYGDVDPYTDEGIFLLKLWLSRMNAYFYAKPRELFHEKEAIELAQEVGKEIVIVEDLS